MHQTKNYTKPGGFETHIGGKLVFEGNGTVESFPLATEENSAGVTAAAKTEAETLEAKIDENGKLWVALPDAAAAVRGGVLQAPAQADSVAEDVASLVADFNTLLGKLRAAGVLASE